MKEHSLKNIDSIHTLLSDYRKSTRFKFRGQSNIDWKLIPKAGRPHYTAFLDSELFRHWKRRAKAYLTKEGYTEWELLSIAQHTGLPTKLLDWTHNPLVAFFFACIENQAEDGVVFIYDPTQLIDTEKTMPFDIKHPICFYQPSTSSQRISSQLGYFTVHTPPTIELNEVTTKDKLEKIVIRKKQKKDIIFMLNQYGINYLTLFPDLEGLSKHLGWFAENNSYWKAFI